MSYERFTVADIDRLSSSGNYMIPVFEDLLRESREQSFKRIVDIGCGDAFFSCWFKSNGTTELVGIDGSPEALARASARGTDATHLVNDLSTERLPLADGSSDFVLCKDVLEHLINPLHLASEIARVLKPSGTALVLVPNHFPLRFRFRFLINPRLDTQNFFPEAKEWDYPHIRFFSDAGFRELFERVGMKPVRSFARYFPLFPLQEESHSLINSLESSRMRIQINSAGHLSIYFVRRASEA